jgi:tripartite-type tricarboxylate transporter receptor subunit TctC
VFAPARVPALVLATLSADVAAVLAEPDMRKKLADLGVEPDTRSPAEFAAYVQSEARKYADVVKRAGLAP